MADSGDQSGEDPRSGEGAAEPSAPDPEASAQAKLWVTEVMRRRLDDPAPNPVTRRDRRIIRRARRADKYSLRTSEDIKRADRRLDLELKRRVAWFALCAVAAELAVANVVFIFYAWKGNDWDVPTAAIQGWLAATVTQVIGILYIIARYLFPRRGIDDGGTPTE